MEALEWIAALAAIATGVKGAKKILGEVSSVAQPRGAPLATARVVDDTHGQMTLTTYRIHNLDERLMFINQMIVKGHDNPLVRMTTAEIVSRICDDETGRHWCSAPKDWWAEAVAVFEWVTTHVHYDRDIYGKDTFTSPVRMVREIMATRTKDRQGNWHDDGHTSGDCDCTTGLLCSMLLSIGFPMRARVIQTAGSTEWNHIYALVGIPPRGPTEWVPLDASVSIDEVQQMDPDWTHDTTAGWQCPKRLIKRKRDFEVGVQ